MLAGVYAGITFIDCKNHSCGNSSTQFDASTKRRRDIAS